MGDALTQSTCLALAGALNIVARGTSRGSPTIDHARVAKRE
jgi:hypothetical protein